MNQANAIDDRINQYYSASIETALAKDLKKAPKDTSDMLEKHCTLQRIHKGDAS